MKPNLVNRSKVSVFWTTVVTALVFPFSTHTAEYDESIVVGKRFRIESKVLNEARSYVVHKPNRYDATDSKYPVLIVLDASTQFAHTSEAVEFLAANGRIPQMLVVGIENTNRGRDLTPPTAAPVAIPGANVEGGAEKFHDFITNELIPEIDRTYRTHSYRVLVGHSLGGLFTLYSMTNKPDAFNAYVSVSPYLAWDKQALVKQMDSYLTTRRDLRADLYMTMGNETGDMLGSAWKLSGVLAEKAPVGLRWQFDRRPEESHGSNPYRSVYDGLKAVFNGWHVDDPVALYKQVGLTGLDAHFANVSARVGYKVNIPESTLQGIFASLMQQQRYAEAEAVLKKALESYSNRYPFNRAATMLYAVMKDEPRVIEFNTNILKIFPGNSEARRTLERYKIDVTKIVTDVELSQKTLSSLAGRYVGQNYFVEISLQNGKLYATTNEEQVELRAMSSKKFYGNNADMEVAFHADKRGKASGLMLDVRDTTYELARAN